MSYEKQTWNKYDDLKTEEENIVNGAVVTDNRMNHIEEGIYSHTIDISNPHKVTAAQVGLDKVDNIKQASKVEFDSHTNDTSNPHKVTATQLGLDKVDNIQQAAKTDFESHVNNKSNPHVVTASQVGAYSKQEIDSSVVHNTGDETIAGKKMFTGDVEVNGSLTLPTKSWSGELGGGITLSLRKKGTTVEYSIGGEISSNILANSNLVKLSVPNEFCPRNRYSLVGHIVGGWNAFHIDIPSSGVCQWFGPATNSGTPRGTGTYPID